MAKSLLALLVLLPHPAAAVPYTPTPAPKFTMTPLPAQSMPRINAVNSGSCALNDCTEVRLPVSAVLPSPGAAALEPAAGDNGRNFCRDVNLQNNPELCRNY